VTAISGVSFIWPSAVANAGAYCRLDVAVVRQGQAWHERHLKDHVLEKTAANVTTDDVNVEACALAELLELLMLDKARV
jgi:hypothetical protein